ncbi:MAG TPA: GNAT family N-acetyltransferase [Steroidobacteraceae bacterium]
MLSIVEVPYASAFYEQFKALRDDVLRRPLGLRLSEADVAGEAEMIHVAALEGDVLLGGLILKPLAADRFKLRQMVVTPAAQRRGIGRQLVQTAEAIARARGIRTVELHARALACDFYAKLGYRIEGPLFLEVNISHFKMVRTLAD